MKNQHGIGINMAKTKQKLFTGWRRRQLDFK